MPKPAVHPVVFKAFKNGIHRKSMPQVFIKACSREKIKGPHVASIGGFIVAIVSCMQDT
jgi:hypothetical protein